MQHLGNYLTTLLRPQDDGTQRCSTNAMTACRAENMRYRQNQFIFDYVGANGGKGSNTDVSKEFVQTEPKCSEMSTQTQPERSIMSTQTELESLDIGTNVLSTTQTLDNFMDEQEQTGVNKAKGEANNLTSEDGTRQIVTETVQHDTNMQQQ